MQGFLDIININILNALSAIVLLFLYMILATVYWATHRDRGLFFFYGGLAWFFNLVYLVVFYISSDYLGLAYGSRVVAILSINTVSMLFFLLAARQRFLSKFPKLFHPWFVVSVSQLVVAVPIILSMYFPEHFWIGEAFVVFFSFLAILAFGRSYQTYFWMTRRHFASLTKYSIVFSIYFYAILQFGHFLNHYHSYFYTAEVMLKFIHILGLFGFSWNFSSDYDKKRRTYKRAQEALRLADQLAHELSTPAAAMRLKLTRLRSESNPIRIREQLNGVRGLVEQLTSLVHSFRSLHAIGNSQGDEATPRICNMNEICDSAIMTLKLAMNPRVRLLKYYSTGPLVYGVEPKLVQVLKNIFKNAIEATENNDKPRVDVETSLIRDPSRRPLQVRVRIQDSGPGIEEEIFPKIFEAGFTTKSGPGRGHGLYIAKAIVREHYGVLNAKPTGYKPYTGAHFEVILPYSSEGS